MRSTAFEMSVDSVPIAGKRERRQRNRPNLQRSPELSTAARPGRSEATDDRD